MALGGRTDLRLAESIPATAGALREAGKMVGLSFDSMGFAYSREQAPDFVPKVGMTAFFFGKGFGSIVRGLVIADRVIYYRTEEEQEEKNRIELEQKRLEDAKEYRRNKPEYDQRI